MPVGGQTRSDFTRDPCPWRLVEDMGGAYSLGLCGGTVFHGGKSLFRREWRKVPRMVRQNAPKTGAAFAIWGFSFSLCDCTLIALRKKEDMLNSVIAGGTTGFVLAARQGMAVATVSGAIGALLLGLIEGGSLLMNRMGTEMIKPMAPDRQNAAQSAAPQAFD